MDDSKKILKLLEEQNKKIGNLIKLLGQTDIKHEPHKKIQVKSSKSITGLITRFAEEGFFDTPKTLKEISEELARQSYHYRSSSLTNPLQRLLRKRSIGRIIVNGKWAYVKR